MATPMISLDEYVEEMRVRLDDFAETWRNNNDADPKNWPMRLPGSVEWNEQFNTLT